MAITAYLYMTAKQLTKNFNTKEFRCKCRLPHNFKISSELVDKLQTLINKLDCSKAIISSGYRCKSHDKAVGGSGSGAHVEGCAVDIIFYDKKNKPISSKIISCAAQDLNIKGIANITKNYDYIHLDMKGRIYRGDETKGNNTVTSDFYTYYKLTKADVYPNSVTATPATSPTPTTPVNNKDTSIKFVYTNKYDASIKELQKILNGKGGKLKEDGIAGPKTYEEVKKYIVEKGDKGPLTAWVQSRLKAKGYNPGIADGIAGNNTMKAIKAFQKANKLGQGYLGGTDWYYLIK